MLTLSADLVFRDYAQAAYRMRGIGKGQRIALFVIPEVQKLLASEAAMGRGVSVDTRLAQLAQIPDAPSRIRTELEDVVGWLLLNSFKSERVQFELWCLHCAQNAWRKEASRQLQASYHLLGQQNDKPASAKSSQKDQMSEEQWQARKALEAFRDLVDHAVSNTVPQSLTTRQQIQAGLDAAGIQPSEEGSRAIAHVLGLLEGHVPKAAEAPPPPRRSQSNLEAAAAAASGEGEMNTDKVSAFGQEQEQQQEQEQEQEKEQQQQQQKEQEQEVEEPELPAKEKYTREDEYLKEWPLVALGAPPSEKSKLGFYPASEFAVHRTILEKRGPLHWPGYLQLSPDHTHPRWRFASHHRLKNLLVFMEWLPGQAGTMAGTPAIQLSETQRQRLHRLVAMYDSSNSGRLDEASLRRVLSDLGLRPDEDERAKAAVEATVASLGTSRSASPEEFCELMRTQTFLQGEAGRYWVVLSLREAESLRGALHLSMDSGEPLVPGGTVSMVCACPIRLSSTRVSPMVSCPPLRLVAAVL